MIELVSEKGSVRGREEKKVFGSANDSVDVLVVVLV